MSDEDASGSVIRVEVDEAADKRGEELDDDDEDELDGDPDDVRAGERDFERVECSSDDGGWMYI
jgi:hypothetical protein